MLNRGFSLMCFVDAVDIRSNSSSSSKVGATPTRPAGPSPNNSNGGSSQASAPAPPPAQVITAADFEDVSTLPSALFGGKVTMLNVDRRLIRMRS